MRTLTLTESIESALSGILEELRQGGPVVLRRGDEDVGVVVSCADYEWFRQQRADAFKHVPVEIAAEAERSGLTEEKLAEILR